MTAPFGSFSSFDHPAKLDPPLGSEQPLKRDFGLVSVDFLAETARCAESEAEELELVRRGPCAVGKQLQALLPHVGVGLVGEQLDAVVERADRRHEVVAEPRAKQAGKIDWVHARR